jgi:alkylation response protein AidB-like acyl-CoA dehydrogenase
VLPIADELDPQKAEMPRSLIEQMAAKGWFGITIPAEHGGMGLGVFEYCLVSEELARAWLSVGSILARGQGLGTQTIDDGRRLELLRRSAQGKWIGAIALSEPTAGSDLAAVQTRAIRQNGYWLLSGTKRWAGFALAADFKIPKMVNRARPGSKHSWWLSSRASSPRG